MASYSAGIHFCNIMILSSLLLISFAPLFQSAFLFRVGGPRGWRKPDGNETETYNEWATKIRFHVGDSLYFKYKNDSVLVVESDDYTGCNISDPITAYEDGNTVIKFDRFGFFYFISGVPGHCQSGQKLIIWVMGQSEETQSPASSPAPESGDGQGGQKGHGGGSNSPNSPNSTVKLTVGSSSLLMAALGGIMAISLFI
ncbi:mavicyanin-like [Tasmannia lanceolata]|uniref:mavicyanin-like n=1 Tax=Tasmannia lanceolata TaxID=3420 RepID=UPI0040642C04